MLLKNGADPNVGNVFGDTPLTKALKDHLYDQSATIKALVENGADTNYDAGLYASRKKGPTKPLFAAIESGKESNWSYKNDLLFWS